MLQISITNRFCILAKILWHIWYNLSVLPETINLSFTLNFKFFSYNFIYEMEKTVKVSLAISNFIKQNKKYGYCISFFSIAEFDPIRTYSVISLALSFLFLGMGIILLLGKNYFLQKPILQKIVKTKPIFFLCLLGIYCERFFFNLNKSSFNFYLIISNGIILAFMLLRFGIIIKNQTILNLPIWFYSIIIFFALLFSLLRGFIRLGYAIETFPQNNPHIVYFWSETTEVLKHSSKRIIKTVFTMPENATKKNLKLNGYTVALSAVGVSLAGGVWWEAHVANNIARENLEVNKRNMDISEISGDRQAVKDGFMTKENYETKWDALGRRRK